jgi:hypothetical protein
MICVYGQTYAGTTFTAFSGSLIGLNSSASCFQPAAELHRSRTFLHSHLSEAASKGVFSSAQVPAGYPTSPSILGKVPVIGRFRTSTPE